MGENRIRAMSFDMALLPHLGDVITALANESEWAQVGDTVEDVVEACKESVESWYSDMLIGQVSQFIMAAPSGWLELDGSTYAENDYPELFAKLPAGWIDGTDFTLPDLDGVFLNGVGQAGTLATTGGSNNHTLTEAEMPSHTHDYTLPGLAAIPAGPLAPVPAVTSITPGTPTSVSGSGGAHENRPAFLTLIFAVYAGRE